MRLDEVHGAIHDGISKLSLERVAVLLSQIHPGFPSPRVSWETIDRAREEMVTDEKILEAIADLSMRLKDGNKLRAVENAIVKRAKVETAGNKSAAARLLGVERKAFERRVRR